MDGCRGNAGDAQLSLRIPRHAHASRSIQGVWGEADESACEEIRCPAFDGWEEMGVGEVQVRPCEKGFAILTCGADGQWEGSPNVCCTCGVDR